MLANILRGFFFRQHVGSHSKSRQHVGQQMLASNVGQNVVSICVGLKYAIKTPRELKVPCEKKT